jgi:transposase InsO family protein
MFFYLYLVVDIFSRKIVGWEICDHESSEVAAEMIGRACLKEGIQKNQLFIHSDNGGPMKGATMLATLRRLGVLPSFSRPSVSDDNAFSEALFRTLKYRPWYPRKPFSSIEEAEAWVTEFVRWYNTEHLHSGIGFVTPECRHHGEDVLILEKRKRLYELARRQNPNRWTKSTRDWRVTPYVQLNGCSTKLANRAGERPSKLHFVQ